jgi:uncharacterized protein YebE (UPF0316 family)
LNAIFNSHFWWLGVLVIFALRVTDMSMDTVRMLFVIRGRRSLAWILGFMQSIIYVLAISSVLTHLDNVFNVIGYGAGFATGNVVGMWIEGRLAIGHTQLSIISSNLGCSVVDKLREAGYAVTEIPARGRDGMVTLISCAVLRKDVAHAEAIIRDADADAFVTAEDVRPMRHGFWRA